MDINFNKNEDHNKLKITDLKKHLQTNKHKIYFLLRNVYFLLQDHRLVEKNKAAKKISSIQSRDLIF